MSLLAVLIPAAAAALLLAPLLRPGREVKRGRDEPRGTDRRAAGETLAEIEDDRSLGLAGEEDREEYLRRLEGEDDE